MMTIISIRCSKCGIIGKSGKLSCCGRGGSWFGTCGSDGNSNMAHTWSEGVRACKPRQQQSKTAISHRLNGAQHHSMDSANGIGTVSSKAFITAAKTFTFVPANTSTPMVVTASVIFVSSCLCRN